METISKVVLG